MVGWQVTRDDRNPAWCSPREKSCSLGEEEEEEEEDDRDNDLPRYIVLDEECETRET